MKLVTENNQLIIKKFLSKVTLKPEDIELIDCSGSETKIRLKSGKIHTIPRIHAIVYELLILDFVYQNKIGFISLDFNDIDTLYLESELQDKLAEHLERIRVLALPYLKEKYGDDFMFLMVPHYNSSLVSVSLGAVKNGQTVRFKNDISPEGYLDEFNVFILARITPINGEVLYGLASSFEDDKHLEDELKEIIEESELE